MAERGRAHAALRAGTRAEHDRLDALFSRFDTRDPVSYLAFLRAHARVLGAVERALDAGGFADALSDWPRRRRADALAADIEALGGTLPPTFETPRLDDVAARWGAAYVLEGSRLGGAMIARDIAEGLPRSYLGTAPFPGAWRYFLEQLDASVALPDEIDRAVAAASLVFALFGDAGVREMESP